MFENIKKILSSINERINEINEDSETETLGELPSKQYTDVQTRPVSGVTRPTTAMTRPHSGVNRPLSGLIKLPTSKNQRPFSGNVTYSTAEKPNRPFSALMSMDEPSLIIKDDVKETVVN